MVIALTVGIGLIVSIVRIKMKGSVKENKKIVYWDYKQYAITHKKVNDNISQQVKSNASF